MNKITITIIVITRAIIFVAITRAITLPSSTINIDDLNIIESILFDFVEKVQNLYPNIIMLSGLHEMLHLVDCTFKFGPLNSINC